ncbi:unnamed protein product [Adineta ricciae]|uniref:AB hydrolase-1 domain-containing protein n=1 Tax=Adineta ricciae TaxID=249248 RepID=A0A815IBY7_ADIRI|nr:unnamed protein product [Adineta ricciae]CAF1523239.1 unnamed protein product [Adineta ricciae]
MSSSTFVLISGGWHPSACWERVIPLLEAQGHYVIAPELLGVGTDQTSLSQIKLKTWVDQIVDLIQVQSKPVVLVGHSRAGILLSEAAQRIPDKIQLLVYLSAYLLTSGQTISDTTKNKKQTVATTIHLNGTISLKPDSIIPIFYNTTSAEWAQRALTLLSSAEPVVVYRTPVEITDDRFGRVPRAYIECLQDKAIPLDQQREMQKQLPCKYVLTLDTDHSPFFSAPSQLVTSLIDLANRQ